MNLGFVAMRQRAEGETLVKRTEVELVRRRQKKQTVIETRLEQENHKSLIYN